jgi:hypothetical protein
MIPSLTLTVLQMLIVLLATTQPPATEEGGSLWRNVSKADFIVEVQFTISDSDRTDSAPTARPLDVPLDPAVIVAAMKTATVCRWLKPVGETVSIMLPGYMHLFATGSTCWPEVRRQGSMRAILYFREHKDRSLEQLTDEETGRAHNTTLNPAYPAYVEAVRTAIAWKVDTRLPAEDRWRVQREALHSNNPYLRRLAASYLTSQHAELAIGEEIRASGSTPASWNARLQEQTASPLCAGR